MASAGVLAVSPVTPPMPNIQDVQERAAQAAVQLTAATNPLLVWGQTIADTFGSLDQLTRNSTTATLNLADALGTGYIFQEAVSALVQNILNPGPLLNEFMNFSSKYGPTITTAISGTFERLQLAVEQFPTAVIESLTYLSQGQFVEAFSKINGWFVLRVLGGVQPLIPILSIPAQFVDALPGTYALPKLLDVVSEFAVTKAIFEPFLGGVLQSMEVLDAARQALVDGNIGDAIVHLVNLPAKALNALLNGMTPAGTTSEWQGLLDRGLVTYLTVTLPNQIANAIKPPAPADSTLASFGATGPSEFRFGGDIVPISLGDKADDEGLGAGEGAGEGTGEGTGEGVGEGAGEGAGEGTGEGEGTGAGEGTGEGEGTDTGTGDGAGAGEGTGTGEGAGTGDGTGTGEGTGAGEGSGEAAGNSNTGTTGSGSGTTTGSNTGTGRNTSGISTSRGAGSGNTTGSSTGGTTGGSTTTGSGSGSTSGTTSGGATGSASGSTTGTASGGATGSASGNTSGTASGGTTGSTSGTGSTGSGSGSSTGSGSGSGSSSNK
ncbi:hypothetical protein [Mycobacterium sp. 1164985.4]|uniref:hypothetical protein n=1 Tax=Mycobacterium sp. 1164985.4 TaxID=1834069 RepID=UPI0009ECF1B8|nr:hypothetical protein [Mycobacterium sp. 1164985.4]